MYLVIRIQFLQKYTINGMILIFILLIARFLMAMSPEVILIVYIYIYNLFALPEHLCLLVTSIVETNSLLLLSFSMTIGIKNSAKHFPNFTVTTLNCINRQMSLQSEETSATRHF